MLAQMLSRGVGLYSNPLKMRSGQVERRVVLHTLRSFMKNRMVRLFGVFVWSMSMDRRQTGDAFCAPAEAVRAPRNRKESTDLGTMTASLLWRIDRIVIRHAPGAGRCIGRIRNRRLVFEHCAGTRRDLLGRPCLGR